MKYAVAILIAVTLAACADRSIPDLPVAAEMSTAPLVKVRLLDKDGNLTEPVEQRMVVRSDAFWKAELTDLEYQVTRRHGTERPFTGALLKNEKEGVYTCRCCGLPLFSSETKFKSGTGWPSFYASIAPENVTEHRDEGYGMVRTEIRCARCDSHLGHVFNDGPKITGLRYCVNSASIAFTEKSKLMDIAESETQARAEAVFAGGCFWCVEAVFEELDGVYDAVSGYAGGEASTANYTAVCTGHTKHAEVVKIIYDPKKISYGELLRVHFATHDPTTLNRQGADVGPQYRSAIFYANEDEKKIATEYIKKIDESGALPTKIVTTLEPLEKFYEAEPKHQNFVCENPNQGYVRAVALPKVEKVRKAFPEKLKKKTAE